MIPQGCYVAVDGRKNPRRRVTPIVHCTDSPSGFVTLIMTVGEGSRRIDYDDDDPRFVSREGHYVLPTADGIITLRVPDMKLYLALASAFPEFGWPSIDDESQIQPFLESITADSYLGP